ncbi:MAG: glycosyltransferase family 2 protein [Desulfobulbaceae bacterium]|nr:glycosyltransferase family 2 protein [Desulfobulbaceae bacterium]
MDDKIKLVSIIVSTYNWPEALAVILASLALQTSKRFEVIIADDGSKAETAAMIAGVAADYPVRLSHVRQEDQGFRAAAARNRAVAKSLGDYLLFLDGDCAVFPDFISTHIRLAEKGCFVAGNRVLLSESFTKEAFSGSLEFYRWSFLRFIKARFDGSVNRIMPLFKLPDGFFRKLIINKWQGAKTCNLGIWRDDFYKVNGFDESFVGWGHEDAELVNRLINSGVARKDGRFASTVLHLWHRDQPRDNESQNMRRLLEHIDNKACVAKDGLDKY